MRELLIFSPVVVVAFVLGILIGMGIQVRSEQKWIKRRREIDEEFRKGTDGRRR